MTKENLEKKKKKVIKTLQSTIDPFVLLSDRIPSESKREREREVKTVSSETKIEKLLLRTHKKKTCCTWESYSSFKCERK